MRILFVLVVSLALAGCKTTGIGVQVRKTDDGYWIGIKTEYHRLQERTSEGDKVAPLQE